MARAQGRDEQMEELPNIVQRAVEQAKEHQTQLIASLIESFMQRLDHLSQDERSRIEADVQIKLLEFFEIVYIGGIAVGVACGKNNVNPFDILPREAIHESTVGPLLTVLKGGKPTESS